MRRAGGAVGVGEGVGWRECSEGSGGGAARAGGGAEVEDEGMSGVGDGVPLHGGGGGGLRRGSIPRRDIGERTEAGEVSAWSL